MENKEFKGYTLEELKYQRALALIKVEKQKETIQVQYANSVLPIFNTIKSVAKSTPSSRNPIVNYGIGILLGRFKWFKYAYISYKVASSVRKFINNRKKD